jgi:IMP and pyridine-specific 5'-nucleotidase
LCLVLQLHASASTLQLVTFDADGTLYADGAHMAQVQWPPIFCNAGNSAKAQKLNLCLARTNMMLHTLTLAARRLCNHAPGCAWQDNRMIQLIIDLMNLGVHVAIVTAAGYPGEAERFEQRVQGLLAAFRQQRLPDHIIDRCNFACLLGATSLCSYVAALQGAGSGSCGSSGGGGGSGKDR